MRELIERMEGFTEAKVAKKYRVKDVHKDWDKENPARYEYEFHTEKFGWSEMKNISQKAVLSWMVANNPKLIGKEIPEGDVKKASKKYRQR